MPVDLFSKYHFDSKAAEDGVRMIVGPDPENDYVVVRKDTNREFRALLVKVGIENDAALAALRDSDPKAADDLDSRLMAKVVAEAIMVDVGPGVTFNGEAVDTKEKREAMLFSLPDFRAEVRAFSQSRRNFKSADIAAVKKK